MAKVDKKLLMQFPPYEEGGEFVGTREYWAGVFSCETNRDPELHGAFSKLHEKIVNEVIRFCKEYDLNVDEVHISASGLIGSKKYGEWCPCTDSSMSMYVLKKGHLGMMYPDRDEPFLFQA